jgi:hypothetical protein
VVDVAGVAGGQDAILGRRGDRNKVTQLMPLIQDIPPVRGRSQGGVSQLPACAEPGLAIGSY